MSFLTEILGAIGTALRQLFGFIAVVLILAFLGYIFITVLTRLRQARSVSEEQNQVLLNGKKTAKALRLHTLYTSADQKKTVKLGKIVSFVKALDDHDQEWHIFAVKKGLGEHWFYMVKPERHSKLFADVILYDWNFRLDAESKYLISTDNLSVQRAIEKMPNKTEQGIDSIGLLTPTIHKAVQVNPLHRIQIRITKLIKIPDETALSMADQTTQYLQGGGEQ
jgi:hypothetical protein